jgi:hypothetical protein
LTFLAKLHILHIPTSITKLNHIINGIKWSASLVFLVPYKIHSEISLVTSSVCRYSWIKKKRNTSKKIDTFFWFFNSVKPSYERLELWSKFNDILKNYLIGIVKRTNGQNQIYIRKTFMSRFFLIQLYQMSTIF